MTIYAIYCGTSLDGAISVKSVKIETKKEFFMQRIEKWNSSVLKRLRAF
jgi:sulfur relay (sulfurtransferase) DsrC/TusE family protein